MPPLIDALSDGKAPTPSFTLGYLPDPRTDSIVPRSAEVSMVMPYLPLPIPNRLSYSSGPLDGFVVASPDRTSELRSENTCRPVLFAKATLVARPWRPLSLFTNSWLALASQVSRCQGSRTSPMPVPDALSALASASICGRVVGGAAEFRPALVNESWL